LDFIEEFVEEEDETTNNSKGKKDKKDKKSIGEFEIIQSNFKEKERANLEKIKDYENSKNLKLCLTIDSFTKKFPNLGKYQEMQDIDIFLVQKLLKIPSKINNYLNQIKVYIDKNIPTDKDSKDSINEKIYDYVMGKIYDKIYPLEPYENDNQIFQQSIRLSWTELKHFMKKKKTIVLGSFENDALSSFRLIDSEKSPRKKLLGVTELSNAIGFLLKFNELGLDAGVDDQLPILNYAVIKSHQLRVYSNAKYMELYIGERKNKLEGSQLTQLLSSCEFIEKLTWSDLNEVTEEYYFKKCNEETNKDEAIKL
jgi:hypothetical protein